MDQIQEIETKISQLTAVKQKLEEYNNLIKTIETPDFEEFLDISRKFVSQFEKQIPLKQGTVDSIKIYYSSGKWYIRFNLVDSVYGETVYDINSVENIDSRIREHLENEKKKILEKISESECEIEDLKENIEKLYNSYNELVE